MCLLRVTSFWLYFRFWGLFVVGMVRKLFNCKLKFVKLKWDRNKKYNVLKRYLKNVILEL